MRYSFDSALLMSYMRVVINMSRSYQLLSPLSHLEDVTQWRIQQEPPIAICAIPVPQDLYQLNWRTRWGLGGALIEWRDAITYLHAELAGFFPFRVLPLFHTLISTETPRNGRHCRWYCDVDLTKWKMNTQKCLANVRLVEKFSEPFDISDIENILSLTVDAYRGRDAYDFSIKLFILSAISLLP